MSVNTNNEGVTVLAFTFSSIVSFDNNSLVSSEAALGQDNNRNETGSERDQIPMYKMLDMDVDSKVKSILHNVQVAPLSMLTNLCGVDESNIPAVKSFIATITNHAVLVRGVWIYKTKFVYSGRMGALRNAILWLYALSPIGIHTMKEISEQTGCNVSQIQTILQGICEKTKPISKSSDSTKITSSSNRRGWELRYPPDEELLKKAEPSFIERVLNGWEKSGWSIMKELLYPTVDKSNPSAGSGTTSFGQPNSHQKESERASMIATFSEVKSADDKEILGSLIEMFHSYGVLQLGVILQKLQTEFKPKLSPDKVNSEAVKRVLSKSAVNFHGAYALKIGFDPDTEKFRESMIELYKQKAYATRKEIDDFCKKIVYKIMPKKIFEKVSMELTFKSGDYYVLKTTPPPPTTTTTTTTTT
eukprot:TRINITY_DN4367_c0_g4_i2.p1 TRINITY_DN4367_c0_g4~~TRINITY_DN4367_c0_g4_i2.p1  ORF type:complete len:417 (-),score=101.51 TRINITY_DN4367_c0_g4_i2:124-1374(-)